MVTTAALIKIGMTVAQGMQSMAPWSGELLFLLLVRERKLESKVKILLSIYLNAFPSLVLCELPRLFRETAPK